MKQSVEEMAEEYAANKRREWDDYVVDEAKAAFFAGYQAAKDQLREAVIVLEKHRVAAEKAVTNIKNASDWVTIEGLEGNSLDSITNLPTSAKWISVKDRLPEEGQRVLLYNSLEYVSIVMAHWYSSSQRPFFDHVTIDDIHMTFALEDNKHLYWMPLPKPPKEDK